ncbi:MAG: Hpt domain-containing protein, partial [Xanthomonadales bacterium]|nr:Hpt domain-containing protein [Xanthomonadales bacterium]
DGKVRQTEEAYQILMRGMLQVPDYLDRLQSGHRDIPIVLLPLLNDLRACRGEKLLTETALFSPDLSRSLPANVSGPEHALPEPVLKANAARLRMAFQLGLLKWFKGEDVSANTARLALILDRLQAATAQVDGRRLWWVGGGLLDAVRADKVDSSVSVKLLVGRVDREIKNLVDHGEAWFVRQPPLELTKNLLYYLAQVDGAGDRVDAIRELYGLRELLPSSEELEHARGVMSGANRQLLDTVGDAIKEDVLRVKDALDLFLRTGNGNVAELDPQREALQRVADTLGMLGLGVPRRLVLDQKDTVDQVVAGERPADENTLLDIAGALLYVESSLDDHIAHLGRDSGAAKDGGDAGLELPQAEVRQILDATMKEAQTNVQQAKQDIVAFIESPWDHSKIEELPRLLEEITGALRMLNLPDAASLLHGITRFIDMELLKYRRVPSGEQLDLLADALASIEYYMEALRDQRGNRERILEVTQRSLEALGYWPLPEMLPEAEDSAEIAPDSDATSSQLPSFGGDFMSEGSAEQVVEPVDDEHMLSIDLPPVEAVSTEQSAEVDGVADGPDERESLGLQTAVEIAPGEGLEALVVGESNVEGSNLAETELHGLSFDSDAEEARQDSEALVEETLLQAADGVEEREDTTLSLDFPLETGEADAEAAPLETGLFEAEAEAEVEAEAEEVPAFSWEMEPLAATGPTDTAEADLEAEEISLSDEQTPALSSADDGPKWYEASAEDLSEEAIADVSEFASDSPVADIEEVEVDPLAAELASEQVELTELSLTSDFELDQDLEATVSVDTGIAEIDEVAVAEVPAVAPVVPPTPALEVPDSGFQAVPSDEIDEEIREVFVEEVQDELENLNRQYPAWVADQGDQEKLKPVRRSFHTLKGSGRLVGALAIGEFSWKIENMLNRVLDKTIAVSPAMLDLMDKAIAALPELLAALRGDGPPQTNIGAIMWCADRLAAGEEVWLPKAEPAPTADDKVAAAPEAGTQAAVDEVVPGTDDGAEVSIAAIEDVEQIAESDVEDADSDLVGDTSAAAADASTEEEAEALSSPLDVDPVLMEILRSEVSAHLQTVRDYLGDWYAQGEPMMATEELLRAVHTLNGAVSMVELPSIAGLVSPLEGYLKRARGHDLPVERRAADLLTEAADAIDDCMVCLEKSESLPDLQELINAAVALRDDLPVVERGYQAFGIHMAEDASHDEAESDRAGSEAVGDIEQQGTETEAEAEERPWYEADLGEEAAALIDELGMDSVVDQVELEADTEVAAAEEPRPWYEAEAETETASTDGQDSGLGDEELESTQAELGETLAGAEITEIFDAGEDIVESSDLSDEVPAPPEDESASVAVDADAAARALAEADLDAFIAEAAGELGPVETPVELAVEDEGDFLAELGLIGEDSTDAAGLLGEADSGEVAEAPVEPPAATESDAEETSSGEDALTVEDFDWLNEDGELAIGEDAVLAIDDEPVLLADAPEEALADNGGLIAEESTEAVIADSGLVFEEFETELEELGELASAESNEVASPDSISIDEQVDAIQSVESDGGAFDELDLGALIGAETVGEGASSDTEITEQSTEDRAEQISEIVDDAPALSSDERDEQTVELEEAGVADIELALNTGDANEMAPAETDAAAAVSRARMPVDPHPEAPLDTSDLDEELLDIFLQEGAEILDQSDGMMAELRQAPDDRETIAGLQRELHTLKGGARMAGVAPIGDLSHAMESLFEALVEGRTDVPGRHMVDVLEHSFDALHRMVQRVRQGRAIATPDQTISVLESLERGELPSFLTEAPTAQDTDVVAPGAAVEETPPEAPAEVVESAKPVPIQPPRPDRLRRTAMDEEEPQRMMQQEVIRVRADLIDNLVNFAGEVSIYRSRLEAQIGGFRFNLVEFDQTVTRLREQLRKLEMETEAQILSRYQREME